MNSNHHSNEQLVLTAESLAHYTGSYENFRHSVFSHYVYTEGVQFVAAVGGAYWLIDEIMFAQEEWRLTSEPFQVWTLTVKDSVGVLVCDDGNGKKLLTRTIPYTDFPLESIKMYFCNGTLMLPSEY